MSQENLTLYFIASLLVLLSRRDRKGLVNWPVDRWGSEDLHWSHRQSKEPLGVFSTKQANIHTKPPERFYIPDRREHHLPHSKQQQRCLDVWGRNANDKFVWVTAWLNPVWFSCVVLCIVGKLSVVHRLDILITWWNAKNGPPARLAVCLKITQDLPWDNRYKSFPVWRNHRCASPPPLPEFLSAAICLVLPSHSQRNRRESSCSFVCFAR